VTALRAAFIAAMVDAQLSGAKLSTTRVIFRPTDSVGSEDQP